MPWTVSKTGRCPKSRPYGVFKKGTTKLMGCHATQQMAQRQSAALYALVKEEREMPEQVTINIGARQVEAEAEAEPLPESVKDRLFQAVADVFAERPLVGKAPKKTVDGKKYPAGDFLVVEDPASPSTWHLQVKRNGTPSHRLMGAAWAALHGGYRGNKYQGPGKGAALKKLRALYKAEDMQTPGAGKGLMLWKEADGSYGWAAVYSNNFRDEDDPPEIISRQSHRRFDELLSKGEVDMPELWLWHRPEWRFGQATWHAYDETGFAVAGGLVDKGAEWLAEALSEQELAVSHGMPRASLKRDPQDETIILEHITREISPLPAWAAANKLTGFEILAIHKEEIMAIPQDKREALEEMGLEAAQLDALEAANAQRAEGAKEAGIESKEAAPETTEDELEAPVEVAQAEPESQPEVEPPAEPEEKPLTRDEIADAIVAAVQPIQEQLAELGKALKELLREDEQKVAEVLAETPAASITDLVKMRAVGNEEARVDGRSKLGRSKPTVPEGLKEKAPPLTPIPWISDMLSAGHDR